MPGWRERERKLTFEDMPEHLRHVDADSPAELLRARADWLEEHGLTLVDFLSWKRSPIARPPSRRKLLPRAALRELDERLEQEEIQW